MTPQELVYQLSGTSYIADKSYPHPLPPKLLPWYVYLSDFGHNIVCILEPDYQEGQDLKKFLVPVPVKAVLRGYQIKNGYIVVNLPYDPQEGLLTSPEDEEF